MDHGVCASLMDVGSEQRRSEQQARQWPPAVLRRELLSSCYKSRELTAVGAKRTSHVKTRNMINLVRGCCTNAGQCPVRTSAAHHLEVAHSRALVDTLEH